MHNGKKTCSGKIPEPKKDENLILDLLGYYDIKEVITDIARGEADLDTPKSGCKSYPCGKDYKSSQSRKSDRKCWKDWI